MEKDYIISEIKRTAKENGGTPLGKGRFFKETGIKETDWYGKYWARWGDAVREAGYQPNILQGAYSDEFILKKLISFIQELGHFPVTGELRLKAKQDNDFPTHNVFLRLGKKVELAKRLIEYCEENNGFNEIIEICKPIVATIESNNKETEPASNIGSVYLLKSGKFYKIGRTTSMGMREYTIALQLPEKVTKIHEIKTDDPIGIEAYWHKRFQEKHKNGEWYELSAADVKIFKRRTFM